MTNTGRDIEGTNATVEISDRSKLSPTPLVSVLMLTYNHGNFIAEAIDGVIRQTCEFPIELIIGDDCSQDDTAEIAMAYQRRNPDIIRLISSSSNVGVSKNFARCIAATHGKYIAICQGDDFWTDPTKLSTQVSLLERSPEAVICFHDVVDVDENGRMTSESKMRRLTGHGPSSDLTSSDLLGGAFIPTLSVVFRNVNAAHRTPSLNIINNDVYLFSMLAQHGTAKGINATMGAYREHAGGVWSPMLESKRHLEALRTYIAIATDIEDDFAIHVAKPLSIRIANAWAHRDGSVVGELYPLILHAYALSILCPLRAGIRLKSISTALHCAVFPVLRSLKLAVRHSESARRS